MNIIAQTDQVITDSFVALPMMGARLQWLDASWPFFEKTGVPLVADLNGLLVPIPVGDDIVLSLLAPAVARCLGLSLHNALSLLLVVFAAIGAALAIGQLWAAFRDW